MTNVYVFFIIKETNSLDPQNLDFLTGGRVSTKYRSKNNRSSQLHSLRPCCAEHISVKMTIPPICIQGTQSYCAQSLAKALQSG